MLIAFTYYAKEGSTGDIKTNRSACFMLFLYVIWRSFFFSSIEYDRVVGSKQRAYRDPPFDIYPSCTALLLMALPPMPLRSNQISICVIAHGYILIYTYELLWLPATPTPRRFKHLESFAVYKSNPNMFLLIDQAAFYLQNIWVVTFFNSFKIRIYVLPRS